MSNIFYLCLLAILGGVLAGTELHPRGCLYIMGKCVSDCEEGTHAYAMGCGYKMPEATCQNPNPVPEKFMMCDYSACYCDSPTVRDEVTNKCVPLSDCSVPYHEINKMNN